MTQSTHHDVTSTLELPYPELLEEAFKENKSHYKVLFVDLETTRFKAKEPYPWYADNSLVSFHGTVLDVANSKWHNTINYPILSGFFSARMLTNVLSTWLESDIVVAHNMHGFDLHWFRHEVQEFCDNSENKSGYDYCMAKAWLDKWYDRVIYCTMITQYMLEAQITPMPSLDYCAAFHGVEGKTDVVSKDYWDKGIDTNEIPFSVLAEYGTNDVKVLIEVFFKQLKYIGDRIPNPKSFMNLLFWRQHSAVATSEMTYNGVAFDAPLARAIAGSLKPKLETLSNKAIEYLGELLPSDYPDEPNVSSNKQLSLALFGGEYKIKEDLAVLDDNGIPYRYKTGKRVGEIKTKKVEVVKNFDNLTESIYKACGIKYDKRVFRVGKEGGVSVDDFVITQLKSKLDPLAFSVSQKSWYVKELVNNIQEIRFLSKFISTYLEGFQDFYVEDDGKIHAKFNECVTITGRYSSSKPNLQNVPSDEKVYDGFHIKQCFTISKRGYRLFELDFSGMELHGQAIITGDKTLTRQLMMGEDLHNELAKAALGKTIISKDERRLAKIIRFAAIYGATAKGIAHQTGVSVDFAQTFLDSMAAMYPEAEQFAQSVFEHVNQSKNWKRKRKLAKIDDKWVETEDDLYSYYPSESGRLYAFRQLKDSNGSNYFKPTQTRNYPIQGFSTGDVVPIALASLMYNILAEGKRDEIRLLLTVHDSVLIEIKEENYLENKRLILNSVQNIVPIVEDVLGREIPFTKFPIEYSEGSFWFNMTDKGKA